MSERQGVEIDYCPKCRGVWLDRVELDKMVERSTDGPVPSAIPGSTAVERNGHQGPPYYHDDDHRHHGDKRRKSWLGELVDQARDAKRVQCLKILRPSL